MRQAAEYFYCTDHTLNSVVETSVNLFDKYFNT